MVERATLIQEIDSLPPQYYNEVIDFVGYIKDKKVKKHIALEKAAEAAAEEYRQNSELTAFRVLDGEEFYDSAKETIILTTPKADIIRVVR